MKKVVLENLIMKLLEKGAKIVQSQGLRVVLINERRDQLKASVLVNGGHFERWMIYANCLISRVDLELGMSKIFLKFQFCATNDVIHWLTSFLIIVFHKVV